jgi:ATP-dependent DNA helicase DinG
VDNRPNLPHRPGTVRGVSDLPDVDELLDAAVRALNGTRRDGQATMARSVAAAIDSREHLVVQAGTGTGKSLGYLVPALRHAVAANATVVVSTATIALQNQLIGRDLPRLTEALEPLLGRRPVYAILKGRRNYLCRYRLSQAATGPEEAELFDPHLLSSLGRQVRRLHEWAEETLTGDRDDLTPGVSDLAWRQVSVGANECIGPQMCPVSDDCFAELARAETIGADLVVTNHALLAIDAVQGYRLLPDHDLLIVDEAHELVDRVTSVATGVLSDRSISLAAKRAAPVCDVELTERLAETADGLALMLADTPPGRLDHLPDPLATAVAAVRDAAHACLSALPEPPRDDPHAASARRLALAGLEEVHRTAERILLCVQQPLRDRQDVVWFARGARQTPGLRIAPLAVNRTLRQALFTERTTVLTSATLALGGSFDLMARQWGLGPLPDHDPAEAAEPAETTATPSAEPSPLRWRAIDVGSPFNHARSGILYIATHLPPPGRESLHPEYLDEMAELIDAAGGRTLGLFSSTRAAVHAAEELRERLPYPILCQGDDSTGHLVQQFAADEATCLFGTLSLWQGVDVPGPALQLVIVDRIPFPRPDDPLASARQRAIGAQGGNGFLEVAATHAALLLAQGTGRLLRSVHDKGVVAVLDPRLATARYGAFLRATLPPYWGTTDPQVARAALRRLHEAASRAA